MIGDFDFWVGTAYPMRSLGSSGVWELFVPGVGDGTKYKFQILGADSQWREKADPMAFATEVPPATASVVFTSAHEWQDADWLAQRAETAWHASPMSIYEVHLGSWRMGLTYRELAEQLVDYVKRDRLHPRRVPAGGRASVRWLLGLPGLLLLRAHRPASATRTTSATWSTRCTGPASA